MKSCLFVSLLALVSASATEASIPRAVFAGTHTSACSPIVLHGRKGYARLAIRFAGKAYASSETVFSDPKCEISVMETTSQGRWEIREGRVLRLKPARLQLRPLDPRMADNLARNRSCGKAWENGVRNEILGTPCGRGNTAEYFVGPSPSGRSLVLHECEGKREIGPGCTRYGLARTPEAKARKTKASFGRR